MSLAVSSTFAYTVRDPLGNTHNGSIEAASQDEATQQLRRDGFQVVEIEEEDVGGLAFLQKGISRNDVIYMTSQLAIMIETGITVAAALQIIAGQETNPTLAALLEDICKDVEGGEDFSAALAKHPKQFDETYVSLVRASEATGMLAEMLERIAVYLRKGLETRSKVRSAMAYPAAMATLAISVTIFLLTFILPKFEPMFNRQGVNLPKPTIVMMAASQILMGYWYLWLAGLAALVIGFLYARRTERGRWAIDWVKIHMPILGPLFRKVSISRGIRTLGTMVASGVSVIQALELTAQVSGNLYYRRIWEDVLDQVTQGKQIHAALKGHSLVPRMLVQMIASGEDTGKLDMVLMRVSDYFDNEVDTSIKTTTSLIEPIMITVMGVVVGGIGMALLLPIFSLSKPPG